MLFNYLTQMKWKSLLHRHIYLYTHRVDRSVHAVVLHVK